MKKYYINLTEQERSQIIHYSVGHYEVLGYGIPQYYKRCRLKRRHLSYISVILIFVCFKQYPVKLFLFFFGLSR